MGDFLDVDDVLSLHRAQLKLYGGAAGVRDMGLLESAVAQPQAGFDRVQRHTSLFDMAAAYAFHIIRNHPFVDGNKRTGIIAALVFLEFNGMETDAPKGSLYKLAISVAKGQTGKDQIAEFFRSHAV